MLEKISWGEYWLTIAIVAAIYELAVIAIFFRKDLFAFASGKLKLNQNRPQESVQHPANFNSRPALESKYAIEKENEAFMPQIHELMMELKNFIQDVTERSFIKEEVVMGLQITLREHKNLIGTVFQKSINDFIATECAENCSIHLSEEELNVLWKG